MVRRPEPRARQRIPARHRRGLRSYPAQSSDVSNRPWSCAPTFAAPFPLRALLRSVPDGARHPCRRPRTASPAGPALRSRSLALVRPPDKTSPISHRSAIHGLRKLVVAVSPRRPASRPISILILPPPPQSGDDGVTAWSPGHPRQPEPAQANGWGKSRIVSRCAARRAAAGPWSLRYS